MARKPSAVQEWPATANQVREPTPLEPNARKAILDTAIDSHCGWCLRPTPDDDDPETAEWLAWIIGHWTAFLAVCPQCAPEVFSATRT